MSTLGDHIHKWGGSFIKCCSECGEPIKQLEKGGEYVLAYGNKALDNLVAVEECQHGKGFTAAITCKVCKDGTITRPLTESEGKEWVDLMSTYLDDITLSTGVKVRRKK